VCNRASAAYLSTICVERRLLIPQFYGFGVEFERGGPVLVLERFVAFVLELRGFFLWVAHDDDACRSAGHRAGVRQRKDDSGKGDGWLQLPFVNARSRA
jgi:hypothetical protein